MEKEFIPYEQALALKELGFVNECIYHYKKHTTNNTHSNIPTFELKHPNGQNHNNLPSRVSAPLYQQAFRWLYQKLDIEKGVMPLDIESQQLLLKKLIDKVSSKHLLV